MLPEFDPVLYLEAWRVFITRQEILPEVNHMVVNSWRRCWGRLNPLKAVELQKLNPELLLAAQVSSFDLISLARPIMEDIYQFIIGSDTVVGLTNGAGYLLDLVGDQDMLGILDAYDIGVGTLISEMEMGTNAFALAIQERMPARVAGAEHYLQRFHELAEAAAPIFDLTGRPLGSLGVFNMSYRYHPHTLGLAVAGARAIEGQHQADYLMAEQNQQTDQLNAIVDASTDGLLVVDRNGILIRMNPAASEITGLSRQTDLGRNITDLVLYPGFINDAVERRDRIHNVEIRMRSKGNLINCIISLDYVMSGEAILWVIVRLRQEKDVRELVQQQLGAQAPLTLDDIPGNSPGIKRVQRFVKVAAPAQASILIRGESGTGKNVLASAIHNASPRRIGPFLIVGCTSIPHEWVVSELLGYDESVESRKPGGRPSKFELADRGTLFFQNIDDLPLEAQSILLNFLDLGIVQRLGSDRPIEVDVRVIASTSANIEKLIAQGHFRADLYYRLSAFEITLPPVREHMEDIPLLVERIMARLTRQLKKALFLEPKVMELLHTYRWPGNVREMEAVLGRAAIQAGPGGVISPILLPRSIRNQVGDQMDEINVQPLAEVERDTIIQAAKVCRGNLSEMSKILGISRTTVWRRVKGMDIPIDEYRYTG